MNDTLVLSYHALSKTWPADLALIPAHFEAQLTTLVARGFRGARMHDAIHQPGAGRVLAVTFDDAYRSILDVAFPVMQRLGVPGTVFVPTDHAGTERPMSWPGIDRWVGGPHEHEDASRRSEPVVNKAADDGRGEKRQRSPQPHGTVVMSSSARP